MSAELAARRTAAAAVAADFHTAAVAFQRGGDQPDYAVWAQRLERHLRYVLDALDVQDRAQPAPDRSQCLASSCPPPQLADCQFPRCTPPQPKPAELAAAQLAEVRAVLGAFTWGEDDLQYALEKVDEIVNRGRS